MILSNTLRAIALLVVTIFISSCTNNDDDGTTLTCTTQGMFYDLGTNPQGFKPEVDLTTDFFITSGNGPEVEIYGPSVVFVTTAVNLNDTGTAMLILDGGPNETVAVTCLATGTNVGDTMRFAFSGTYNGQQLTGELCVTIDVVN